MSLEKTFDLNEEIAQVDCQSSVVTDQYGGSFGLDVEIGWFRFIKEYWGVHKKDHEIYSSFTSGKRVGDVPFCLIWGAHKFSIKAQECLDCFGSNLAFCQVMKGLGRHRLFTRLSS